MSETTALIEADDAPSDALVIFGQRDDGIEHAKWLATQLDDIIRSQKLFAKIGDKDHLVVEAWCTCASLCGLSPMTEWSKEIRNPVSGALEGFEARVLVKRVATDLVVGAAEAACYLDEKMRGKTRWTEKFAAKSMAQTRATSKAISQILRWIPVMAGYAGTPFEEVDEYNRPHENPDHDPNAPQTPERARRMTAAQLKALLERWKRLRPEAERTVENWRSFVHGVCKREFNVQKPDEWTADDAYHVDATIGMEESA